MNRKQFIRRSALFTLAAAGLSKKAGAFTGERISRYISVKTPGAGSLFYAYDVNVYNSDLLKPEEDAAVTLPLIVYTYPGESTAVHLTTNFKFTRHGAPQKNGNTYLLNFDKAEPTGEKIQSSFPDLIRVKLSPDKVLALEISDDKFVNLIYNKEDDDNGMCFLTTACTKARSLPDDCAELQAMRFLRDAHMMKTGKGAAKVSEYYRIAPQVVQQINLLSNHDEIWNLLYADLVLPAKRLVEENKLDAAEKHYSMYVEWVKELFG